MNRPAAEEMPLNYSECESAVLRLNEFLSHALTDDEKAELQTHLEECSDCLTRFQFEENLLRTIRERLAQVSAPVPLRARIMDMLDREVDGALQCA